MLKANCSQLFSQKASCRPALHRVFQPRKPQSALRSLGSSRGKGSSRGWDDSDNRSNWTYDGGGDREGGSAEELGLNSGTGDWFLSSSSSSSTSSVGNSSNEGVGERERVEPYGSGAGEHGTDTRGIGSSRDWVLAGGGSSSTTTRGSSGSGSGGSGDWDQGWKDWVWENSSGSKGSRAPESATRGGGSSRGGYDSFMTSTGVSWAPSSGYNINSYNRMNEERLEGLQWLARYLAGKRQKGWLWDTEAKAFAELRRRGIECCAHHGGKHLYFVPGHSDQLSPGGVFRILFQEVDALRESNERVAREDKRIADDLRAAIQAKIQPQAGSSGLGEATPPAPPPLKNTQDQAPGTSQPPPSSECNDSPQECLNHFLFGNGQEPQ